MIRVEVIEDFNLKDFDKIKNIQRVRGGEVGKLYVGDTFDCDEKMAKYLTGENAINKTVVKVLKVEEEKKEIEKKVIYLGDEQTPPQYEEVEVKSNKKSSKKNK